jgi:hypothetical protein
MAWYFVKHTAYFTCVLSSGNSEELGISECNRIDLREI